MNLIATPGKSAPIQLWLAPAVIVTIGFLLQSATFLNHDVAWVLYSSGRLLGGGVFGRDIIAANPPLIWWISAIPSFLSKSFGAPPVLVFRVFVAVLAVISLALAERLMRPQFPVAARAWILVLGAYLLFIGVHRDYGQREHLALILTWPYLLAVAWRMRGDSIPPGIATIIGIGAGVGISFKPHFVVVPFMLEAILVWRRRAVTALVRPESIAAAVIAMAYVAAIVVFARPYISDVVPAILQAYWAFSLPFADVVLKHLLLIELLLILVLLVARAGWPAESTAGAAAAAGFLTAGLAQSKGYSYHFYPVLAFVLLSLAMVRAQPHQLRWLANISIVCALSFSVWQSATYLVHRSPIGTRGAAITEMTRFVGANVPEDGHFLALATHPYPGFPTALYADRDWASASNSLIFMPSVVRLRQEGTPAPATALAVAEEHARAALRRDIETLPDLVLVDRRRWRHAIGYSSFDFLDFFQEDPWFDTFWRRYRELDDKPRGFRAFVLDTGPAS